jgi:hypothetical protein
MQMQMGKRVSITAESDEMGGPDKITTTSAFGYWDSREHNT